MRGLMERLFRSRAIRLALSLVLMASLVGCSTKEEISRGGSGEVTATDSGSLEIAGGHADVMLQGKGVLRSIDAEDAVCSIEDLKTGETASYRVSDNAANMIESIPTGAQVSFRYLLRNLRMSLLLWCLYAPMTTKRPEFKRLGWSIGYPRPFFTRPGLRPCRWPRWLRGRRWCCGECVR